MKFDMGALFRGVPAESVGMFRALQLARETVYLHQVDEDGALQRLTALLSLKRGCRR